MLAWVCVLPLTVAHPPDPDGATHAVHPLPSEGTFLEDISGQPDFFRNFLTSFIKEKLCSI